MTISSIRSPQLLHQIKSVNNCPHNQTYFIKAALSEICGSRGLCIELFAKHIADFAVLKVSIDHAIGKEFEGDNRCLLPMRIRVVEGNFIA